MNRRNIYVALVLALSAIALSPASAEVIRDTTGVLSVSSDNAAALLLGRVAGVRVSAVDGNPLGDLNVNIRGINTLRTDNRPLWIVDGTFISSDVSANQEAFWQYDEKSYTSPLNWLQFLNPTDIESIEVLKDVSATSIYGTRGANGVIIVNTKKGAGVRRAFDWQSAASVNLDGSGTGLKPGVGHTHRLSFNGAGTGIRYNVSASLRSIDGTCARNEGLFGNVKGNFETKANDVVWFALNALAGAGKSSSPSGTAWLGEPSYTLSLRDPSLSSGMTADDWTSDYDDDTQNYRALFSTYLRFNITKSLYVKLNGGIDFQDDKRVIWYGKKTTFGAISLLNLYGGAGSIMTSRVFNYNAGLDIVWSRYFGKDHHVELKLAGEATGYDNQFNTMNAINYVTHELRGKATGTSIGNSTRQNRIFGRTYLHHGAYATAGYSWKDAIGADASCRYDNTPKYNGQVSDIYPAASGWVDVRKLAFSDSHAVSGLKVSGGWGKSGYEKYVPFEFFKDYLSGSCFEPESGTEPFYDGVERALTGEWHAGAEFSFLDSRLDASVTYYNRSTDDRFEVYCNGAYDKDVKDWNWTDPSNVASRLSSVLNKGYEFTLGGTPVRTGSVTWRLDANLTLASNQMTSANPEDFYGKVIGNNIYCTCNAIGLPVSTLFGYRTDEQGNIVDVTGEGLITPADKVDIGNTIPKFYGGLQSSLSLFGFTFDLYFDGAGGHNVANVNNLIRDGKVDSEGKVVLTGNYVEKADYLRLSYAGLRYDIPVRVKWLKNLSVNLSGRNLFTLSSCKGWNPDVNSFGKSALSSGVDYGSYPLYRSIILGFSARF